MGAGYRWGGEESRRKMRTERFYLALLWSEVAFDYPNKKKIEVVE